MPVSNCEPCGLLYFFSPARAVDRCCPSCNEPLRILDREQFQCLSSRLRSSPGALRSTPKAERRS